MRLLKDSIVHRNVYNKFAMEYLDTKDGKELKHLYLFDKEADRENFVTVRREFNDDAEFIRCEAVSLQSVFQGKSSMKIMEAPLNVYDRRDLLKIRETIPFQVFVPRPSRLMIFGAFLRILWGKLLGRDT